MADQRHRFQVITGGQAGSRKVTRRWADSKGAETFHRHVTARHSDTVGKQRWAAGMVVPVNITRALDLMELYGPEVDRACNAAEPEVDRWEEGTLYPRWDQVVALAALTERPAAWFTQLGHPLGLLDTSLRYHLSSSEMREVTRREANPITRYPDGVVARCEGTDLWKQGWLR